MTIGELREDVLKEYTKYIRYVQEGDLEDLEAKRVRIRLLMEAINKKLKDKEK